MFTIKHFDDYHEIPDDYVEIDCLPPKRGNYNYNRYFAICFNRKPSVAHVMERLEKLVDFNNPRFFNTVGWELPNRKEVAKEVKKALNFRVL